MKAGSEIRNVVTFRRLNLNDEPWQLEPYAQFDLVFCRNVLMYFEAGRREMVLRRLTKRLPSRGYLFLGDAEGLNGFQGMRLVVPSVYTHTANAETHRVAEDEAPAGSDVKVAK